MWDAFFMLVIQYNTSQLFIVHFLKMELDAQFWGEKISSETYVVIS